MLGLMFLRRGLRQATVTVGEVAVRAVVDRYQVVDARDQRRSDEGLLWTQDMPFELDKPTPAMIEIDDGPVLHVMIMRVETGTVAENSYVKAEFIDAKQLRDL